jgi:hypothetical protein
MDNYDNLVLWKEKFEADIDSKRFESHFFSCNYRKLYFQAEKYTKPEKRTNMFYEKFRIYFRSILK